MHEVGLAEGVLDVVLGAAGSHRVTRVRLQVGELHAVDPESFEFAFELVAAGSPAAGAAVEVEPVPIRLACRRCGSEVVRSPVVAACPVCGSTEVHVVSGDELAVTAIELDDGTWRFAPGASDAPTAPDAAPAPDASDASDQPPAASAGEGP